MRRKIIITAAVIAAVIAAAGFWLKLSFATAEYIEINRPDTISDGGESVYGTDICVTVDGRAVQAYSIGGRTEIAVEDLSYCGFTVSAEDGRITADTYYLESYDPPEINAEITAEPIGETEYCDDEVRINNILIRADSFGDKHYVDVDEIGALTDDYNVEVGWSDYNFNTLHTDDTHIDIECFRFPAIDTAAILAEMRPMVTDVELELYTEGERESEPRALYEPTSGVLAGINGDGNGDWVHFVKRVFENDFSVYSSYLEFDLGQTDLYSTCKRTLFGKNALMLVPWNTSDVTLAEINEDYIRETLDNLKSYDRPVIVRYACEMNVSELGNSPTAFVKAFRFVADIVHEYGFATMWSVNDLGALNKPYELYYPGDEYVDWIGVSAFPTHDFMQTSPTSETDAILFGCGDYGWHTNNLKYITEFMEENGIDKPLAVSEGAIESYLGYDGAPEDFTEWGTARLANMYWYLPMRYPNLKMITYFNVGAGDGLSGCDISLNDGYVETVQAGLTGGAYILEYGSEPEFSFVKAVSKTYAADEAIPLYAYVYLPAENTVSVKYFLDGELFAEDEDIPYKAELDLSSLDYSEHTLDIKIHGEYNDYEMSYTLSPAGTGAYELARVE